MAALSVLLSPRPLPWILFILMRPSSTIGLSSYVYSCPPFTLPVSLDVCPCVLSLFFCWICARASVIAIKLDSTPFPVLAEASKTERPVLLVKSCISSSETCLSGILSKSSLFSAEPSYDTRLVFAFFSSTRSYLFAITIIWILLWACVSTSFSQLSIFKKLYLSKRSKTKMIPSAPL